MTGKITQIRVQGNLVGLYGLEEAFQAVAALADTAPETLQAELLDRVAAANYIPREARPVYKAALWREFRRAQGEALPAEDSNFLEVVVLGAGCFGCQQLHRQVIDLLAAKGVKGDVQYITDPARLQDFAAPQLPALVVNGRTVLAGRLPALAELEGLVLGDGSLQSGAPSESEGVCPCK